MSEGTTSASTAATAKPDPIIGLSTDIVPDQLVGTAAPQLDGLTFKEICEQRPQYPKNAVAHLLCRHCDEILPIRPRGKKLWSLSQFDEKARLHTAGVAAVNGEIPLTPFQLKKQFKKQFPE